MAHTFQPTIFANKYVELFHAPVANISVPCSEENNTLWEQSRSASGQRRAINTGIRGWYERKYPYWVTAYRILIGLTFIVNLAILAAWLISNLHISATTGSPLSGPLVATSANLFVAVLVRQEDLINASFSLVAKTPATLPLQVRKLVADFHHYGGLHIGCAISALAWYCVFVALNTIYTAGVFGRNEMTGWLWADIITCYTFLAFIIFICVTALPCLRSNFHNTFEHTHRFGGWASLLVLWINAGIGTRANDTSHTLYKSASIWFSAATTFLIVLPWLRIRRVPICAEPLSGREVIITFPYVNVPFTSTVRLSLNPLREWHAFATIPSLDSCSAHVIISQAGDWTKAIIQNPPREIWIRKPTTANFLAFTQLFNSVVLVATGAGIGPMLSLLRSPTITAMKQRQCTIRVMWCVYDPDAPYWAFAQDIIHAVDPKPKIFDSRDGRPDVAFEAQYMKQVEGIEAVMVVSNKTVTDSVVRRIKALGGAAYGAVFDS
ncbi:hypothetical protein BKA66DRAFT_513564 [Pyrenochaeta sp. MPI-SDFR-AT-0127]|nr:hypothetical protein BKA66DRAFT_513564 [Pyrenochaeta sp. MPI-SDFR-AT-0127]